ncbi:hypothetical protein FACS1894211_06200 [Clostridia bacterium]|nr:hypothetical protein FACS1894211_06200 [Clostridia bacterium]
MKYCVKCGQELEDAAQFCTRCGNSSAPNPFEGHPNGAPPPPPQNGYYPPNNGAYNYAPPPVRPAVHDSRSFGFALLGFIWPLIGLILYLIWKDERPLRAKSCGKGALVGVICQVALVIVYIVVILAAVGFVFNGTWTDAFIR